MTSIVLVTPESALQRDYHVFESPMHDVPVRSDCHRRMSLLNDVEHNRLVETFCWLRCLYIEKGPS
jgi:hypothetical protein